MQSTLVERLRSSVTQCRALDRSQLLEEAAAEIERLRLTDAEREAVAWAISWIKSSTPTGHCPEALCDLLARLA